MDALHHTFVKRYCYSFDLLFFRNNCLFPFVYQNAPIICQNLLDLFSKSCSVRWWSWLMLLLNTYKFLNHFVFFSMYSVNSFLRRKQWHFNTNTNDNKNTCLFYFLVKMLNKMVLSTEQCVFYLFNGLCSRPVAQFCSLSWPSDLLV